MRIFFLEWFWATFDQREIGAKFALSPLQQNSSIKGANLFISFSLLFQAGSAASSEVQLPLPRISFWPSQSSFKLAFHTQEHFLPLPGLCVSCLPGSIFFFFSDCFCKVLLPLPHLLQCPRAQSPSFLYPHLVPS